MFTLFLSSSAVLDLPAGNRALRYQPDRVRDPYLDDGAPPAHVAQLYFASLAELEAAAAQVAQADAEAMQVHRFSVPEPWAQVPARYCTYLVAYEGPAENEAAWLAHYLKHHPPIMRKLPHIRELEIYTPVEWRCPAPLKRVRHMQRNKVAFDDAAALAVALDSPVRREMRADFAGFPPYRGRVTHYAMTTEVLRMTGAR
ncbi:MAG TPA: EthD family reductase [Burkholderiales bacterium]|nr:EthD family reductase [Burkholderiales bacterium]